MGSFVAAACQIRAGTDPRQVVLQAARGGARLVVLPAFCLQAAAGCPPGAATTGSSPTRAELLETATGLAEEAGCYLVAGTVILPAEADGEETEGYHQVAWLISPKGRLVGEQAQTHTTREEEATGLLRSGRLAVFSALGLKVGLLVGLDAWVPEVARILALEGADILAAPLAVPAPYSEARQLAGVWQVTQQNQTFGLEAYLVGEMDHTIYAGRSAITAPCESLPDGSGLVVQAPQPDQALTVMGAVDLEAREKVIEEYDVLSFLNTSLYRRVFPMAYLRRNPGGGSGR